MKRILVRGPALSQSGYGEHTRFVLRALRSREEELDLYLISTSWGATNWIFEDDEERTWLDSLIQKTAVLMQQRQMPQPDTSIQVTIPLEWERIAPINIGVTAGIETTKIAGEWIEKANMMDKIIVPSEFARFAFDETSYDVQNQETGEIIKGYKNKTPIEVIPYPRKNWNFADNPKSIENQISFETAFNFLAVAQWGPRKNLENLIKWFIEENFDRENVGLVLKTNLAKNCEIDRVACIERLQQLLTHEDYKDKKCKIYLLHGYMTEEEMALLYRHKDIHAFITTTHGEGYGLPLFEAAQAGLPIIAPAWSGHVDFLTMPVDGKNKFIPMKIDYDLRHIQESAVWDKILVKDSMWCFPKEGSFKMKLRSMMDNYNAMKKKAVQLANWLEKNWDNEEEVWDKIINNIVDKTEYIDWTTWSDTINEVKEYD
jgi:glycosyltransferase involved in cell wall biosynthesis